MASPGIAKLNGGENPTLFQKFTGGVTAALVGGTASSIGGGKFANGAKTAMIQYLYNEVGKRRPTQNSSKDQEGSGWLRPDGHKYVVGRDNHPLVWSGEQGPGVGSFIDDYVPAGHTFGTNHDAFVELMVDQIGIPDVMVNIPSMPPIYIFSVVQEMINTPYRVVDKYFGTKTVPYEHSH